ncbi:MAG: flagellar biosynthetic protein FliO [Wenzhouxiangella sp.]
MTEWIWLTAVLIAAGVATIVTIRQVHNRRYPQDGRVRMRVVQNLYLGTRERLVVVTFDEVPHLFGIGGGQINYLGRYDDLSEAGQARPSEAATDSKRG